MLRILGAVLIVAGCSGIGFWYRQRFHAALRHLRCMQHILELFMSEIRYGKSTLPECCRQIGERVEEPYKEALFAIYRGMQPSSGGREDVADGTGFSGRWREAMDHALMEIPISQEEKEMFLGFSDCCGLIDNRMQLRAIEQYRDMLAAAVNSRERELGRQSRMAAGLGIMSGLLLAVILI